MQKMSKDEIQFFKNNLEVKKISQNFKLNRNKIFLIFYFSMAIAVATVISISTHENNQNNEHKESMNMAIPNFSLERESVSIRGNQYLHPPEDNLFNKFLNNDLPLIKKYATKKDYQLFTEHFQGKKISDIIEWEKKESPVFMEKIFFQQNKFKNIINDPQVKHSLTNASYDNKILSLHIKITNNSPYDYNAIKGIFYITDIFNDTIAKPNFSFVQNIKAGETKNIIYDIEGIKNINRTKDELKNLHIKTQILKISTYDEDGNILISLAPFN